LEQVETRLKTRRFSLAVEEFRSLDARERTVRIESEELRAGRNRTSNEIAQRRKRGDDASSQIREMKRVSARIKELDESLADLRGRMEAFLSWIPNLPAEGVPVGRDSGANKVVRVVGDPPEFSFPVRDHVELGARLGILDLERASKIAGARFSLYSGAGALLERALINMMLDLHTRSHGYREVIPPFMANRSSFFGTGNLPKFEEDLFRVADSDYFLVPTAEVPLTNIFAGEILEEVDLPINLTAYTPCFRSEAGSYGKDTRGLIRLHQFNKVELVKFTQPEDSSRQLEQLTSHAEAVLKALGIPYRVVVLSTGDMGFSAAKTYDLEVWVPSQNTYREISSCSNFTDFQARRCRIRYRPAQGSGNRLVHTLNGSGLAAGRTWVALVENFQEEDGSVRIPEALHPYMHGLERLVPEGRSG
jgi:seryl-tRNA synthetase